MEPAGRFKEDGTSGAATNLIFTPQEGPKLWQYFLSAISMGKYSRPVGVNSHPQL